MMGVTVAHITASSLATWALLPVAGGWAAALATIILVPLMLVFGEVIPKAVASEWATALLLNGLARYGVTSTCRENVLAYVPSK